MNLKFWEWKYWKTVTYALENVLLPIFLGWLSWALGTVAQDLTSIIIVILGISFVIDSFRSIGETSFWWTVLSFVIGVALWSNAESIANNGVAAFLGKLVSSCVIIFVGQKQWKKVKRNFAEGTQFELVCHILAWVLYGLVLGGGILTLVGNVLSYFETDVAATLLSVGGKMVTFGCISWVAHTVLILVAMKKSGRRIVSTKKENSGSGRVSATQGGASESKVRSEMQSLAGYLTGGWDSISGTLEIVYQVSSSVEDGCVTFRVHGELKGDTTADVNYVKDKISSAVSKRQQLVMDKAKSRLREIKPDREYSIRVETY